MPYQLMQFDNMTTVELERRDCELLQEINHIKAQLEFADSRPTECCKLGNFKLVF